MSERKWTTEQLQAITERGRNILVSAGAGSGKTAVMVERATRLILDDRVPVSSMLIVTFTNAAASEMRERLRQALKDRLAEGRESELQWIREQLDDLHSAQISTFHAFAQRVIKEFFHLIDIEPGSRVLDEAEAEVLKEEALEELFNAEYEEGNDDFRAFLDSYSGEKSDSGARRMILDIYRKLEAVPDGLDVLDEKTGELELGAEEFCGTKAFAELLKICRRYLGGAVETARTAEELLRDEGLCRLADLIKEDRTAIEEILGLLDQSDEKEDCEGAEGSEAPEQGRSAAGKAGTPEKKEGREGAEGNKAPEQGRSAAGKAGTLDRMAELVRLIKFVRLSAKKDEKESYEQVKDIVKALRDDYKAQVGSVTDLCYASLDTMLKVMRMTAPFARTATRLVRRFSVLFREIKNEHKGIDYSDMEHFAYEILQHKEAADFYRELFRYIFIDEYQDTNYMQETIVSMIARPDDLFMVGDVKQSIYHFRLADPEIFQNKYNEYKRCMAAGTSGSLSGSEGSEAKSGQSGASGEEREQAAVPVKIDLNRNFRSKAPVIREINNMFRPLMDGYDEDAELICGVEQGEHALPAPKTYIVDRAADSEDGGSEAVAQADTLSASVGGAVSCAGSGEETTAADLGEAHQTGRNKVAQADDPAEALSDEELADVKKEELEARQAVQIIRENLGKEYSDPKSGGAKKVDLRDIVILMRSFRRSAEGYRKVFAEAGIPLYIDDRSGYFDTIEINVALALLTVIDNKRHDVPFIALLRSEIFGFSVSELAMIRKLCPRGSYVEAAEYAAGLKEAGETGSYVEAAEYAAGLKEAGDSGSSSEAAEYAAGLKEAGESGSSPEAAIEGAASAEGKAGSHISQDGSRDAVLPGLRQKCRRVFSEIAKWQTYAVTLPLPDMIWRILNETGYYIIAGTFPGGAARQANLRLLCDRARDYSERSLGSLYGFIRYIDTLKKNQVEMPQATLLSENENVVRIMTIHHSKGLEFPVVILAGMDNRPKGGSSGETDFDREIGLGLRARDPERHLKESTLIQRIIAAKEKQAEIDELRRVYYVAVTRARETFYLLGAAEYDKVVTALECGRYSDSTLLRMSRYLPEIVRVSGAELLSKPLSPEPGIGAPESEASSKPPAPESLTYAELDRRLGYEYPYAAAGRLAAKTSVTGLNQARGQAAGINAGAGGVNMRTPVVTGPSASGMREGSSAGPDDTGEDSGQLLTPDIPGMDEDESLFEGASAAAGGTEAGGISFSFDEILPGSVKGRAGVSAAKTGTVYHKIMEKLDFTRAESEGCRYVAETALGLADAGVFTDEEVKTADPEKIENFFRTDLGKRCVAAEKAGALYKEQSFESRIEVSGESVLVQGVIDCWFEEEGEEVLIDYKTNRIDPKKSLDEEKDRLREMYRTQLEMYADAVARATGRRVKEKYLYLFAAGEAVAVD